ncbi:MAG: acylphosphatase [Polaromonas sp.]|nr:acylphosphatase [Gemmatimonadaceae bacterium]
MRRLHLRISGRVQGVGFRWFTREEARRLGLSGWVTNLDNGDVEVSAAGEASSLDRLQRALEVGPTGAGVVSVTELGDTAAEAVSQLPYPFTIHP